jgi:hypothetical protein
VRQVDDTFPLRTFDTPQHGEELLVFRTLDGQQSPVRSVRDPANLQEVEECFERFWGLEAVAPRVPADVEARDKGD